jgi:hypothetical protein
MHQRRELLGLGLTAEDGNASAVAFAECSLQVIAVDKLDALPFQERGQTLDVLAGFATDFVQGVLLMVSRCSSSRFLQVREFSTGKGITTLGPPFAINFAPRLGVAYVVHPDPNRQMVLRAGAGLASLRRITLEASTGSRRAFRPLGNPQSANSATSDGPYGTVYANPQHLQLPYTFGKV